MEIHELTGNKQNIHVYIRANFQVCNEIKMTLLPGFKSTLQFQICTSLVSAYCHEFQQHIY